MLLLARDMAMVRGPMDRLPPAVLPVKTADGFRYELPLRLPSGMTGWVFIEVFDGRDDPMVSIWESARDRR